MKQWNVLLLCNIVVFFENFHRNLNKNLPIRLSFGTLMQINFLMESGIGMIRRLLSFFVVLLLLFPVHAHALLPRYPAIPDELIVKIEEKITKQKNGSTVRAFYPATVNSQVNEELAGIIDGFIEETASDLPEGKKAPEDSRLEVRPIYSPTGVSWLSFLILSRTVYHRQNINSELVSRTYDISSGKRILLTDIFPEDSPGWDVLSKTVHSQLSAYFPEEADPEALNALCSKEALKNAEFTLGAVKLELHYPAAALYKSRTTLMHVKVYYRDLQGMMTGEAAQQTDNSRYPMIALTFDDGPRYVSTMDILDDLQDYGAKATFFVIGDQIEHNRDVVQRQQDEGHTVASHTLKHYDPKNLTVDELFKNKAVFDQIMQDTTGLAAPYMRAPGGSYQEFVKAGIGLPLIQWSVIGGDITTTDNGRIKAMVATNAQNGGIVLLHDTKGATKDAVRGILFLLQKKGFLCVTVEDLFIHNSMALEPNVVYRDANGWIEEN
jgi:peptidoglycan-N-acetylglucosamine deacetylase